MLCIYIYIDKITRNKKCSLFEQRKNSGFVQNFHTYWQANRIGGQSGESYTLEAGKELLFAMFNSLIQKNNIINYILKYINMLKGLGKS